MKDSVQRVYQAALQGNQQNNDSGIMSERVRILPAVRPPQQGNMITGSGGTTLKN